MLRSLYLGDSQLAAVREGETCTEMGEGDQRGVLSRGETWKGDGGSIQTNINYYSTALTGATQGQLKVRFFVHTYAPGARLGRGRG